MHDLASLVRLAYSGERAAAYAYQGHAASVKDPLEKIEIKRIEDEEWAHRENLKRILGKIGERPSPWLEIKFAVIGRCIGLSCHFIGWFMPMYFAGRLESGNVTEYVDMEILARAEGLDDELDCIREMARVEKQHEIYFLDKARRHWAIRYFPKVFKWGPDCSFNALKPESSPSKTSTGSTGRTS